MIQTQKGMGAFGPRCRAHKKLLGHDVSSRGSHRSGLGTGSHWPSASVAVGSWLLTLLQNSSSLPAQAMHIHYSQAKLQIRRIISPTSLVRENHFQPCIAFPPRLLSKKETRAILSVVCKLFHEEKSMKNTSEPAETSVAI